MMRIASPVIAVIALVGLEIVLIAILTACGVTGAPAVVAVIVFALLERVAYVRWFKKKPR